MFPFSLMGKTTKWLYYLPRDSITTWRELIEALYLRLFRPSRMMSLRDNFQDFKCFDGEQIIETSLKFHKF